MQCFRKNLFNLPRINYSKINPTKTIRQTVNNKRQVPIQKNCSKSCDIIV